MRLSMLIAREMRCRPGRAALTFLGIVLGVAAVVSVALSTLATRRAYRDLFAALGGRASLEVVAEGYVGFDPAIGPRIEALEGIRAAVPQIQARAALIGPRGALPVVVLGIDPARNDELQDLDVVAGSTLSERAGLLMEEGFARAQGLAPGAEAQLLGPGGTLHTQVAGLLAPGGIATLLRGGVVFLRRPEAAQLLGLDGEVNSLQIVLDDPRAVADRERAIAGLLPPGLRVQRPTQRSRLAEDSLLSSEQGLSSISIIALVAGAFIILNTFHMNLAERRRQLAILRAVGATRRQVMGLLLREALLLGCAGSLVGTAAGVLFSIGLNRVMGELLLMELPELGVAWEPLLLGPLVGIGTTLLATYLPARRAGRREPLAELASHPRAQRATGRGWQSWLGLGLLALTGVCVAGFLGRWLPAEFITPAMAVTLTGFVLALPLLLTPLLALARKVLIPFFGIEGRLGLRSLERHRGRTALTAGVLVVALIANIGSGSSIRSSMDDIGEFFERTATSDCFVRAAMPDMGLFSAPSMPEAMEEELAALPGVARVGKLRFFQARVAEQPAIVLARTVAPEGRFMLDCYDLAPAEARHRLLAGEALAGTNLAQKLGLKTGDSLPLETPRGTRLVPVGGLVTEYTAGGMALYLEWSRAQELLGMGGVDAFLIDLDHGAAVPAGPLQAYCEKHGLLLQSNAELRARIDEMLSGILASDWMILALVFVVAALGIVNTLTMNVLEQTRELGTLRAIGMLRLQLQRIVLSQALGLACVSVVPGVLFGLLLSYLMVLATLPLLGHPVAFHVDWTLILLCSTAAVAVSALAAIPPARRAARLQIDRALQYE